MCQKTRWTDGVAGRGERQGEREEGKKGGWEDGRAGGRSRTEGGRSPIVAHNWNPSTLETQEDFCESMTHLSYIQSSRPARDILKITNTKQKSSSPSCLLMVNLVFLHKDVLMQSLCLFAVTDISSRGQHSLWIVCWPHVGVSDWGTIHRFNEEKLSS